MRKYGTLLRSLKTCDYFFKAFSLIFRDFQTLDYHIGRLAHWHCQITKKMIYRVRVCHPVIFTATYMHTLDKACSTFANS